MTGPTAYTNAINDCIEMNPNIKYRILGVDYEKNVQFSFRGSKTILYGIFRKNHWKKLGDKVPVMNSNQS